jgi:fluoroacetyl-CoA thioesterase
VNELIPGLYAKVEKEVTAADTALMLGSGDVEVYGTPAVVALCELAAVHAVAPALGPNETTVGSRIDIEHLAPTVVGRTVTGYARVESVDGRRIAFSVEASDPAGVIARGTHVRVRVDRDMFMANAWDR